MVSGSCYIQISNRLSPIFSATPKRQRGRKAQQARAAASVAATISTAVAAGATATVTNTTVTAATTVTNANTTVAAATTTATATAAPSTLTAAAAATTVNLIDEENPFIESTHNQSSQLEDRTNTLVIRSSRSSSIGKDSSTSKSSEVGAPNQKNRKEAQDVNEFFLAENGRWYCKFCKYVSYFYLRRFSLSNT
jgi:type IV secretory pathway VirJ component